MRHSIWACYLLSQILLFYYNLNTIITNRDINKIIKMKVLLGKKEQLMQSAIDLVENSDSARAVAKRLSLSYVTLSRRAKNY